MKRSHISILMATGGLLCAAAYIRMRSSVDPKPPRGGSTRVILEQVHTAIQMYELDTGVLPSELRFLIEKPKDDHWAGPYLKQFDFRDPWGTPVHYLPAQSNSFELISAGPDCQFGTDDDITRHAPRREPRPVNWGGGM